MENFDDFNDIDNMDVDSILSSQLYSPQTSGTNRPHLDLDSVDNIPSPKRQKQDEGEESDHDVSPSGLEDRAPDTSPGDLEQREAAAAPVQAGTSTSAELQPGHQAGTSSGVQPETSAGNQAGASSTTSGVQPDSSACSSVQAGTSSGSAEALPGTSSGSEEALPGTSSGSLEALPGISAEVQGENPEHLSLPDLDLDFEADGSWESQAIHFLKISLAKLRKCRSRWIGCRPPLVTIRNQLLIQNSIRRAQRMAMDFLV